MPNYTYHSVGDGCESCETPFFQFEAMGSERLRTCPDCGALVRVVILNQAQTVIKAKHRSGFTDYREDLARHPGDKEAFVSSPQQTDLLVEKRKRQGWRVRDEDWGDMGSMIPDAPLDQATPTLTKNESEAMFKRCLDKGLAADH